MFDSPDVVFACADPREGEGVAERIGRTVLLLGVGKAAAAASVSARLARHSAAAVVLFGVAGSYPLASHAGRDRALAVGDLALVGASTFADEGVATPTGFLGLAEIGIGGAVEFEHDASWLAAAATILGPLPVVRAATVSTCSGTDELARERAERSRAGIETMESAAVALACRRFAVPLLELRAVSNRTGDRRRAGFEIALACAKVADAVEALARGKGEGRE
ncbi:MAG: futalosine hydrolase [Planctomycetota bacterium]